MPETLSQSLLTFNLSDRFNISEINHNLDLIDSSLAQAVTDYQNAGSGSGGGGGELPEYTLTNYSLSELVALAAKIPEVLNEEDDNVQKLTRMLGQTRDDLFYRNGKKIPARFIDFRHFFTSKGRVALIFTPTTVTDFSQTYGKTWTQYGSWLPGYQNWPSLRILQNLYGSFLNSYVSSEVRNLIGGKIITTNDIWRRDYRNQQHNSTGSGYRRAAQLFSYSTQETTQMTNKMSTISYNRQSNFLFIPSAVDVYGPFRYTGSLGSNFSDRGGQFTPDGDTFAGVAEQLNIYFGVANSANDTGWDQYHVVPGSPHGQNLWTTDSRSREYLSGGAIYFTKVNANDYFGEQFDWYGYYSYYNQGQGPNTFWYPQRIVDDGWRAEARSFPTAINTQHNVMTTSQWCVASTNAFVELGQETLVNGQYKNGPMHYIMGNNGNPNSLTFTGGLYSETCIYRPVMALASPN